MMSMTASELDVRNRNTTPTIGPSRNAVTLTSAVIANTRSSWRLTTSLLRRSDAVAPSSSITQACVVTAFRTR